MDTAALAGAGIRVREYTDRGVVEAEPVARPNFDTAPTAPGEWQKFAAHGLPLVPTKQLDPAGYPVPVENWREHLAHAYPEGQELTIADWISWAENNHAALSLAGSGRVALSFKVERARSKEWAALSAGKDPLASPGWTLDTEAENRKTRANRLERAEVYDEVILFKAPGVQLQNALLCYGVALLTDAVLPLPGTTGPMGCLVKWITDLRPWEREVVKTLGFNRRSRTFGDQVIETVNDLAELPAWIVELATAKKRKG